MRIIKPEECKMEFISFFKDKSIVPIVGSGVSIGVKTVNGKVPSGTEYYDYMLKTIQESGKISEDEIQEIKKWSFPEISNIYEDDEIIDAKVRKKYFENNFFGAEYEKEDIRLKFYKINWPYIYSLNVDDAIENSTEYDTTILPNRQFNEEVFEKHKCVLKLHGDIKEMVTYKDSYKVFSSKEYASSLQENRSMLLKLASDYGNINMLFIGCSLSSEVDLLALDSLKITKDISNRYDGKYIIDKKNFFFTVKEPSVIEKTKYKRFGITDIVVFESFSDMYAFLYDSWNESCKVHKNDLENFTHFNILSLDASDTKNQEYFYMALNLVDYERKTITYPYFIISRDMTEKVLLDSNKYGIQILDGPRFSGKSYFLANIYKGLFGKEKYLFDGRVKLSEQAITELINQKNIIILFDTDALDREKFELILRNNQLIINNNNTVIIMLHTRDSYMRGLIQLLDENGVIDKKEFVFHNGLLSNEFTKSEVKAINKLLPETRLQPYSYDDSLINHLMNSSYEEAVVSKYSDLKIPCKGVKEIALSIAIASNEVLYYSNIVNMEFEDIISEVVKKCTPLIEVLPTKAVEKTPKDMSCVKYVLNSKFWMREGLKRITDERDNSKIIDAYRYLIERLIDYSKENLNKRREKYRKIIYFDTINDIFGGADGGKRQLVADIYASLNDLLGTDYQYNHQRAKCLMRNAYYQKTRESKEKSYLDANKSALISKKQIENEFAVSKSGKLLISLAHVEYTLASITASMCDLHQYKNTDEVTEVINNCYRALRNPYNEADFYKEKERERNYGIIHFIRNLLEKDILKKISNETREKYNELLRLTTV